MDGEKPHATINDSVPILNILPFGACISPSNPVVASTHLPTPCTPITTGTWLPGSPSIIVGSLPGLNQESVALCMYEGVIRIINPGQKSASNP